MAKGGPPFWKTLDKEIEEKKFWSNLIELQMMMHEDNLFHCYIVYVYLTFEICGFWEGNLCPPKCGTSFDTSKPLEFIHTVYGHILTTYLALGPLNLFKVPPKITLFQKCL